MKRFFTKTYFDPVKSLTALDTSFSCGLSNGFDTQQLAIKFCNFCGQTNASNTGLNGGIVSTLIFSTISAIVIYTKSKCR